MNPIEKQPGTSNLPLFFKDALKKEAIQIIYNNVQKLLQPPSPTRVNSYSPTPSSPTSYKIRSLWESKGQKLNKLQSESENLGHSLVTKKNQQLQAKNLFSQIHQLNLPPEEERKLFRNLAKFAVENKEAIKSIEETLSQNKEKIEKLSPTPSPTSISEALDEEMLTDPIYSSLKEETVLSLDLTLKNPPENPYSKEKIRNILDEKEGVNQEIVTIEGEPVLQSLVLDGLRSLNINYEKKGSPIVEINNVDHLSHDKELSHDLNLKIVEKNIKNLYNHVGRTRMNKIALLLSHGTLAPLCKAALAIGIKSDYPELDIDPKKIRLAGKETDTITETPSSLIIKKEVLLQLQEPPGDENYSDEELKSCYLAVVLQINIPIHELDQADFLTRPSKDSNIDSSLTFSRPFLVKEAALAYIQMQRDLPEIT